MNLKLDCIRKKLDALKDKDPSKSLRQVAKDLGVSPSALSMWANFQRPVSRKNKHVLASIGIPYEEYLDSYERLHKEAERKKK